MTAKAEVRRTRRDEWGVVFVETFPRDVPDKFVEAVECYECGEDDFGKDAILWRDTEFTGTDHSPRFVCARCIEVAGSRTWAWGTTEVTPVR